MVLSQLTLASLRYARSTGESGLFAARDDELTHLLNLDVLSGSSICAQAMIMTFRCHQRPLAMKHRRILVYVEGYARRQVYINEHKQYFYRESGDPTSSKYFPRLRISLAEVNDSAAVLPW